MRTIRFTTLLALLVMGCALSQTAAAQSASGSYQFTLRTDKYLKYVEFSAETLADGSAAGSIYFTDEAVITIQDVDGTGEEKGRYLGYNLKAEVDGLIVDKNRAVISATIRDSSILALVGQRVLLTVEDNGDNTRVLDTLTWGIYKPIKRDWVASDGELKEDPGVGLTWWATDAERRDDVGYKMPREETFDTKTFPMAAYGFEAITNTGGDIRVSG